jgi:TPP-dependent pyruvate/acetoin dehydrogenase alpha subunit
MVDIPIPQLRLIYSKMVLTRAFDTKLNDLAAAGEPLVHHSGLGQEATPVTACAALRSDDYVMPYHRGWAWAIGKGMEPKFILSELMGKKTGYMGGRGGAQMADWNLRIMGRSGMQGAHIPITAGVGLSIKMRKGDQVVLCFFGDGPPNIGEWHEGMNLAAIWRAPAVFICESNGYAEGTPRMETMLNERIAERAVAYRMPGVTIDGNDIFAVQGAVQEAVDRARKGEGPTLIEALTYRWLGHFPRDVEHYGGYRPKEEVDVWRAKCPIRRAGQRLMEMGILTPAEIERIEREAQAVIDEAVGFAKESPYPTREELLSGVFVD